jgi:hypothetical protein
MPRYKIGQIVITRRGSGWGPPAVVMNLAGRAVGVRKYITSRDALGRFTWTAAHGVRPMQRSEYRSKAVCATRAAYEKSKAEPTTGSLHQTGG